MPIRRLSERVLKWPDAEEVRSAAARWAESTATVNPDVRAIGIFGSYARGDWGVGSDLDAVVVVDDDGPSSRKRSLQFDTTGLPIPVDLLVYTEAEWDEIKAGGMKRPAGEMIWLYSRTR